VVEESFASFIQRERDRLYGQREVAYNQQQELKRELIKIDRELAAIAAYERTKSGELAMEHETHQIRYPQARKGSRREELLRVISEGGGIRRRDILERMELKGDKTAEMSVSNALSALIKAQRIRRDNGRYYIA
jgi:hypothetical protein